MITIKNLNKTFHSGRGHIQALLDVSFSAGAGATTAIVGKSGSGKTTLLYCIGGLMRPDSGIATCFGTRIDRLNNREISLFQRQNMGFIFQYGNLLSYYTVFDNIALPLVLNGADRRQTGRHVEFLLERVGLAGAGKALPNELSGGEAQRVAAARAIAHSPRMILADEPTASLDSESSKNLIKLLFEMTREQQCSLILSTHDRELISLCDQSFYMRDGRLLNEDT
jgi:ABC-type lipoprotein export system ATPase subunit